MYKFILVYEGRLSNISPDLLQLVGEKPLSYDVTSGSEITPCNKICKPLAVYRFSGNVMTSITTLRRIELLFEQHTSSELGNYHVGA